MHYGHWDGFVAERLSKLLSRHLESRLVKIRELRLHNVVV